MTRTLLKHPEKATVLLNALSLNMIQLKKAVVKNFLNQVSN